MDKFTKKFLLTSGFLVSNKIIFHFDSYAVWVRYRLRCWLMKIGLWQWTFFDVTEFSFKNFDLKNECKNKFKDNNEKFQTVWPRNSHTDSVGVNEARIKLTLIFKIYSLFSIMKQFRTTFHMEKTWYVFWGYILQKDNNILEENNFW